MLNTLTDPKLTSIFKLLITYFFIVAYFSTHAYATGIQSIYVHAKEFDPATGKPLPEGGASIQASGAGGEFEEDVVFDGSDTKPAWTIVCRLIGGSGSDTGLNTTLQSARVYVFRNSREGGKHVGSSVKADLCCKSSGSTSGAKYVPKNPLPRECVGDSVRKAAVSDTYGADLFFAQDALILP